MKFFGRNGKARKAERAGRTGIGEPHGRLWDKWGRWDRWDK